MERFKTAAMQNIARRYHGTLTLSGIVRRYDLASKTLVSDKDVTLEGPFSYVLLAALVDRLEPTFVVAPLRAGDPSAGLDVVVIRPSRCPVDKDPQLFAQDVLLPVTGAMYDGGKHVDLAYGPDGALQPFAASDGDRPSVVEYYRCDRVEWRPSASSPPDERDWLLCIDGALETIPADGCAIIEAVSTAEAPLIWT
jgi:hypothetical protein